MKPGRVPVPSLRLFFFKLIFWQLDGQSVRFLVVIQSIFRAQEILVQIGRACLSMMAK